MSQSLIEASINCTTQPVPSNKQVILEIDNTGEESVTILTCHKDGCKGTSGDDGFVKCPLNVPAQGKATIALDEGLHFLVFVTGKKEQECWPKVYGQFPAKLTLPLAGVGCAAAPRPAGPAPPLPPSKYSLDLQPKKRTGSPQSDFQAWSDYEGVEWLTANLDGRMDLCDEYTQYNITADCSSAPDMEDATEAELQSLATQISSTFCAYDKVAGVQLDLEPFKTPYADNLVKLMGILASQLRSGECVNGIHPKGRFLALFTFAESLIGSGLLEAMGSNAFITISGYDLYADSPDTKFNTPAEYRTKLIRQVKAANELFAPTQTPWTLGIPMTASAHEYEAYKVFLAHHMTAPLTEDALLSLTQTHLIFSFLRSVFVFSGPFRFPPPSSLIDLHNSRVLSLPHSIT